MRTGLLLSILLLLPPALAAATTPSSPSITFENAAAVASGFPAGGQVAWFSMARELQEYAATLVRRQDVLTADSAGMSRFQLDRPVAGQSVWVAVDMTSGAYAVATPTGFPLRQIPLPVGAWKPQAGGAADQVQDTREYLEALLVRPGQGVWGITVGAGGKSDEGGTGDGASAKSLMPLKESITWLYKLPSRLHSKDPEEVLLNEEQRSAAR
ncbi:MAG: hypothetical protein M3O15_12640 [Acidobacteriota bacterium]|nr:hypothetical protein [Acidobacteriota bacterium]